MTVSTISYLTDVHFGVGAIERLASILEILNVQRPLCVTDQGLVDLGFTERLPAQMTHVFAEVPTNPDEECVDAGVHKLHEYECDGIVALGGGSPIDAAKAIALKATHPSPLADYAMINGGVSRITGDKPPVVAIPTTAGTGSEVGRAALITVRGGTKLGIISPNMIPNASICDPQLTVNLPKRLTAATGVDAISHCVETFCSPKFNPVAESIALDGLSRAWKALPLVLASPSDLELRSEMMMAAMQGALAFQKGLGLIHSLSHPMGALPRIRLHHGELNGVFMPHVLRFNAPSCPEKMERLAGAIASRAEELPLAFRRLLERLELPTTLSEMGVTQDDLGIIPPLALVDHSTPSNPRQPTEQEITEIIQAAFSDQ